MRALLARSVCTQARMWERSYNSCVGGSLTTRSQAAHGWPEAEPNTVKISRAQWSIGFVASLFVGILLWWVGLKLGQAVVEIIPPVLVSWLVTILVMATPAAIWCQVFGWKRPPSKEEIELNKRLVTGTICARCHHSFGTDETKVPYEGRYLCGDCAKTLNVKVASAD